MPGRRGRQPEGNNDAVKVTGVVLTVYSGVEAIEGGVALARGGYSLYKEGALMKTIASKIPSMEDAWALAKCYFRGSCFIAGTYVLASDSLFVIERIEIGDRVRTNIEVARNDDALASLSGFDVNFDKQDIIPGQWNKLYLSRYSNDEGITSVQFLRPTWWIAESNINENDSIYLSMPELSLEGQFMVDCIEPSDIDSRGLPDGMGVVPRTFAHGAKQILYLCFEGDSVGTGVTYPHRFFSAERNRWVEAGELHIGEAVRAGDTSSQLTGIEKVAGNYEVYNIEVHNTHNYYVTKRELLVHNAYGWGALGLRDGMQLTENEALEKGIEFLGKGYSEPVAGSGRYVSADGTRIFRMGESDITGAHGGGPHVNFETLVPNPSKPGKMMIQDNLHIYIKH